MPPKKKLIRKKVDNDGNIPNDKLKCWMIKTKNGMYRTCATPEKGKKPKTQVRGKPRPDALRVKPYLVTKKQEKKVEPVKKKKEEPVKKKEEPVKKKKLILKKKKEEPVKKKEEPVKKKKLILKKKKEEPDIVGKAKMTSKKLTTGPIQVAKKIEAKKRVPLKAVVIAKPKSPIETPFDEKKIFGTYLKMVESFRNSNVKFPVFTCSEWASDWILNWVLEKNTSDCLFMSYNMTKSSGPSAKLTIGYKQHPREYERLYDYHKTSRDVEMNDQHKKYGLDKVDTSKTRDALNGGYDHRFIGDNGFDKVYEKYVLCKKKNMLLCIPLTIGNKGGHRNMLIINHHTNTFERYEPHGARTGGRELSMGGYLNSEEYDDILKKMMNYINKEYKEKFKYVAPAQTCPRPPKGETENQIITETTTLKELKKKHPDGYTKKIKGATRFFDNKNGRQTHYTQSGWNGVYRKFARDSDIKKVEKNVGFQHLDGVELEDGKGALYNGILYNEVKGYCCMWSFFVMDLRLKNPKIDPQELMSKAYLNLNKGVNPFRTFIRAYTNVIMDDMEKAFGNAKNIMISKTERTKKGRGAASYDDNRKIKADVEKFMSARLDITTKNLNKK